MGRPRPSDQEMAAMKQEDGLNRRTFLKSAGMTAVLGTVGARTALAENVAGSNRATSGQQLYDFDEEYSRVGTD